MPKMNHPIDENSWTRAKATVKKQYPDVAEGSKKFFKLVMTIFKDMAVDNRPPKSKLQEVMADV